MSDSKEHILETAFSLFLQKSFKEVTMNEIVNATGLSKGAFYHYFPSKEKLFFEIVDTFYFKNMMIDYGILNKNSLFEFYHDYIDQQKKVLGELKEILKNWDEGVNINYFTILFDSMNLFPGFKDKMMEVLNDELKTWTKVIESSRNKKEFSSPMTDEQIARMFIYSNNGISLRLLLEGKVGNLFPEILTLWDNFYKELKD
ncbi:MAG: TetR/AcrR family transcriptional regulator [Ignavibacteriales bacterium]|nr:TetR/AcrR family transcriptional regulator [Ignavibacteriales bacterium]